MVLLETGLGILPQEWFCSDDVHFTFAPFEHLISTRDPSGDAKQIQHYPVFCVYVITYLKNPNDPETLGSPVFS